MNVAPKNNDTPGHLARRFQQIAVAAFQTEMDLISCDITPVQYAALSALAEQPEIDQATLSSAIALDRATVTGVIDRLAAKGLVTRSVSQTDRRARMISLTPKGNEVLNFIGPRVEQAQRRILQNLSPAEGAQLMQLLQKVVSPAA